MKCDIPDEILDPMISIVKQHARDLLATASLVAPNDRTPQVIARAEDSFFNVDEIEVLDASE